MLRLGEVYNIIDEQTLQVKDLEDEELYEVKGNILAVEDLKLSMEQNNDSGYVIEFDDELMEMGI